LGTKGRNFCGIISYGNEAKKGCEGGDREKGKGGCGEWGKRVEFSFCGKKTKRKAYRLGVP